MASVTVPNYGLLTGLADGANAFLNAYQTAKGIKHQQKMQELLAGVTQDENGNLIQTPEKQQQIQAQAAQAQGLIYANSPEGRKESAIRQSGPQGLIPKFDDSGHVTGYDVNDKLFKAKASANPMATVKLAQLDETRNQNATKVGHDYEADPIIKNSKVKVNAMNQSSTILDNPKKPVTAKDFNAAYQDYLAGTAPGGNPTEGKANREIPETFDLNWNTLRQKMGSNDDLRKTEGGLELINLLKENIRTSKGELQQQIEGQADNIHENYLQSTNPKVLETNKQKLKTYAPGAYAKRYGGAQGLIGNSAAYAAKNPEDLNQGAPAQAAPKEGDTKVWQGKTYKVQGGHWVAQ